VKFVAGETMLLNGTYLNSYTNNRQFLRQLNASGSATYPLMWINSQDQLVLGNGLWKIPTTAGHLLASTDNVLDIGNTSTNRPRTGYFGTAVVSPVFQITTPLVAPGNGAVPILGAIGGAGPQSAAQNGWARMLDSTGAAFWVPVWK